MSIAENIKYLRLSRGLSQGDLADIADVSPKTVSSWELGTREPRLGAVERVAAYFHVEKSSLLFGDVSKIGKAADPKVDGLSPLEARLMELVRRLTDDQKKMLLAQIELLLSKQE